MKTTIYVHTLDGCPGCFDGWQVCYAVRSGGEPAYSLAQIRHEQKLSRENREAAGLSDKGFRFGYVRYRVEVPE